MDPMKDKITAALIPFIEAETSDIKRLVKLAYCREIGLTLTFGEHSVAALNKTLIFNWSNCKR